MRSQRWERCRPIQARVRFKLYDTFGLPLDFMKMPAAMLGYRFDHAGFDAAMEEQRQRAQASWKGGSKASASPAYQSLPRTEFEGYRQTLSTGCEVLAIIKPHNGTGVGAQELKPGERGEIVLDHTPFYAEAGGQVGDVGWLYADDHNTLVAEVEGVTYPVQGVRAHRVVAKQTIHVGDKVDAMVNDEVRRATMRNHTGTHLLHAALREVLGKHVKQAGSLVDPSHLRFDFSHFASVGDEELQDIEDLANKEVLRNDRVEVIRRRAHRRRRQRVPRDGAVRREVRRPGARHPHRRLLHRAVRRHAHRRHRRDRADQGPEGRQRVERRSPAGGRHRRRLAAPLPQRSRAGERRLHAGARRRRPVSGRSAEARTGAPRRRAEEAAQGAGAGAHEVGVNLGPVGGARTCAKSRASRCWPRAPTIWSAPQLRVLIDNLRNKLGSGVVVLGSVSDGKVALIVGVTKDLTSRVQAGKVIAEVAKKVGGSGGGRPDMAEAGGKDPAALDSALADSYRVVEGLLS